MKEWYQDLTTKFLFFTGKGGVGKTSLACAVCIHLSDLGKKVLLISTDPASNLDEMFEQTLSSEPSKIQQLPNLYALNINPEVSAQNYREKMVAPYRGKLPKAVINSMEEQFSGSCTTEIAAFDEFVKYISDQKFISDYDHIVFDTAPTGHTLRLLSLPGAWSSYLNTTTAESSCLGPLAGLKEQRANYENAISELSNPECTTIVLVARPDNRSLSEASRAQLELMDLGIKNFTLLINAVFKAETADLIAKEYEEQIQKALKNIPSTFNNFPVFKIPLLPVNTVGIDKIRSILACQKATLASVSSENSIPKTLELKDLIEQISLDTHGVILTMGKGGVGKTTVAVLIAEQLARLGKKVLLTTTDPAGNITDLVNNNELIKVEKIDPIIVVSEYRKNVLEKESKKLTPEALDLLAEDLRSPCTEEIAVFYAFAEAVSKGKDQFVVIDTAPTGHTILLMDATESYHREVLRTNSNVPEAVKELLPKLRDKDYTKVFIVALPEPTPVHEAQKLQNDLRRAGIEPYAWVINRSFLLANTSEPLLMHRAKSEITSITEAMNLHSKVCIIPWKIN